MPTHYECAYFASQVYVPGGGVPLPGWEIHDIYYPHNHWGLGMASYINRNHVPHELIIAYRGTNSLDDILWSDIGGIWNERPHPGQGGATDQATDAIRRARTARAAAPPDANRQNQLGMLPALGNIYIGQEAIIGLLRQAFFYMAYLLVNTGMLTVRGGVNAFLAAVAPAGMNVGQIAEYLLQNAGRGLANAEHIERDQGINLDNLVEHMVRQEELGSVTIVGHSMGGYLAEITACRLRHLELNIPIEAVVYDSPGTLDLANNTQNYRHANYDFITSYHSAPNIVNTCHRHGGINNRLYVPHVEQGWTYGHAITAVSHDAFRAASAAAAFFSGGLTVAATAAAVRLMTGVVDVTFRNWKWLKRQHSMENMLACFNPNTGIPMSYSSMESWPHLPATVSSLLNRQLGRTLHSLLPWKNDSPGLHNLTNENEMREWQVRNLPGYAIAANIGQPIDWVAGQEFILERQAPRN